MKHKLAIVLLATASFTSTPLMAADVESSLSQTHEDQRPEWLQAEVDVRAAVVANKTTDWPLNGRWHYGIGDVNEHTLVFELMKSIVDRGQKEFRILDIGCADFMWGKMLKNIIERTGFKDIDVHIVGLTGAKDANVSEKDRERKGVATLHVFEGCAIENLERLALTDSRYEMFNGTTKFNMIISASTFRHFADSLGSLKYFSGLLDSEGIMICELQKPLAAHALALIPGAYVVSVADKQYSSEVPVIVWGDRKEAGLVSYLPHNPAVDPELPEMTVFEVYVGQGSRASNEAVEVPPLTDEAISQFNKLPILDSQVSW